jgi:hypothetical protein
MRDGLTNNNSSVRRAAREAFTALIKYCSTPEKYARLTHNDLFQWLAEILDKKNDQIIPEAQIEVLELFKPLTENPKYMPMRKVEALLAETMSQDRPTLLKAQAEYFRHIARNQWLLFAVGENELDYALSAIARHSDQSDDISLQFNRTIILRAALFGLISGDDIINYARAARINHFDRHNNQNLNVKELINVALLIKNAKEMDLISDTQCREIADMALANPHYKMRDMGKMLSNMIPKPNPKEQKPVSIPKRNPKRSSGVNEGPAWIDSSALLNRFFNRHADGTHLLPGNHMPKLPLFHQVYRLDTQSLRKQPVVVSWAGAALNMA